MVTQVGTSNGERHGQLAVGIGIEQEEGARPSSRRHASTVVLVDNRVIGRQANVRRDVERPRGARQGVAHRFLPAGLTA